MTGLTTDLHLRRLEAVCAMMAVSVARTSHPQSRAWTRLGLCALALRLELGHGGSPRPTQLDLARDHLYSAMDDLSDDLEAVRMGTALRLVLDLAWGRVLSRPDQVAVA